MGGPKSGEDVGASSGSGEDVEDTDDDHQQYACETYVNIHDQGCSTGL